MNICFEFLQVALGIRKNLSRPLDEKDWRRCFVFCKKQALLGIGFSAVERLHDAGVSCPADLMRTWYVYAMQIEKKNNKLNRQCMEVSEHLEHDGLQCCILKGQSYQMIYPESLKGRRTPGDIDIWCCTPKEGLSLESPSLQDYGKYYGHKAIREYVRQKCRLSGMRKKPRACYHHIDAPDIDGTHVEVHYRPSFLHSPIRNCRQQRYFSQHADECMKNKTPLGFSMLTPSVNIVYQMCHLFAHQLEMGLGLRQMMDFYLTLKCNYELRVINDDLSAKADEGLLSPELSQGDTRMPAMTTEEIMKTLCSFGIGRFTAAVMWVLHEVFDLPTHYYVCEPDAKKGRKLLDEIMFGGNFGQYDERDKDMRNGGMIKHGLWKLKRVMSLVSSYPEEALCEPLFRVWHLGWRIIH